MTYVGLGKSLQGWRSSDHLCSCGAPAPDTTICVTCGDRLAGDLGDVPAYAHELEVTLTRQRAVTYDGGSRGANTPLLFHLGASEASWVLRNTLVGWIRVLDETGKTWPAGDLESMSRWLLTRCHDLATHEAGDQAVEEITSAMGLVRRVIDRPADRIYIGQCSAPLGDPVEATTATVCDRDLYAVDGRQYVTCDACGASWDVKDRRGYLLDVLDDVLATATEIAAGLTRLGTKTVASTIRSWAHRGRLQEHGLNLRGEPLYRIGDVRALYEAAETRTKEKAS